MLVIAQTVVGTLNSDRMVDLATVAKVTMIGLPGDDIFVENGGETEMVGVAGSNTFIIQVGGEGDVMRSGINEDAFIVANELIGPVLLDGFCNPFGMPSSGDTLIFRQDIDAL